MFTAVAPSPPPALVPATGPSEFARCLDAGVEYDAVAELVWACVEAGVSPSMEVLVFFQPDDTGARVADGDVPADASLGGQISTCLTVLANTAPVLGADAMRLTRMALPRLLELFEGQAKAPGVPQATARADMKAWREVLDRNVDPDVRADALWWLGARHGARPNAGR